MLKIGEFSKLSMLTIPALRFYEKEGLLIPASTDPWSGYRFYETAQLETAAKIKAFRQLGFSLEEIRGILSGGDIRIALEAKAEALTQQQAQIATALSVIHHLLEENDMKYSVTVKQIPAAIVYSAEKRLANVMDKMQFIPECGEACLKLNPGMKCAEPAYEFCEYPDEEYRETDVLIRHSEAVTAFGKESDFIKFRSIPETKVLSLLHKGPYEQLGQAYAFLMKYAEENGYRIAGFARECYIDGIWNKDSAEDWLTEIQLPIE